MFKRFPFHKQLDAKDCGPTCLRMIGEYYGKRFSLQSLRDKCIVNREGTSVLGLSEAAEKTGFRALAVKINSDKLGEIMAPFIVHLRANHFAVVYKVTDRKIFLADPGYGLVKLSHEQFNKQWNVSGSDAGIVLVLEPTPAFYTMQDTTSHSKKGVQFLLTYVYRYKKYFVQLFVGLLIGSLLELVIPFLAQALVDTGIQHHNINFVYLILAAQLSIFLGRITIDFIRVWILVHISNRINISIVSDFLVKLLKLPIPFFDEKMIGDIFQRLGDHKRIETFLTSTTLSTLFSMTSLVAFGSVLAFYDGHIFMIFLFGAILSTAWIFIFQKRRKDIDYKKFSESAINQSNLVEMILGMQEVRLNGIERLKRWEWEKVQVKIFKLNTASAFLEQKQQLGHQFLNELKNIVISFLAAKAVIDNEITLGMMLSVTYIIGQLNAPITQLISFIHNYQDAKISIQRIGEIHDKNDEEDAEEKEGGYLLNGDIVFKDVSFRYTLQTENYVFENLNLIIPKGKTTAIVGSSGSGKSTLLKLLLKFYIPESGIILAGNQNLNNINNKVWRQNCGVVMQNGYIFSDTILNNITMIKEDADLEKAISVAKSACIHSFIEKLPLKYETTIGESGVSLSNGQNQRILIARALYRSPELYIFDEATSALDAQNERSIKHNLEQAIKDKTVVIVAHRLSTVRNADKIVVLDEGKIIESGTHEELVKIKGTYFELVKEQLALEA